MKMKKVVCLALVCCIGMAARAQSFQKGDIVADVHVGLGIANTIDSWASNQQNVITYHSEKTTKVLFTQRFGAEFGVCDFSDNFSLGVGFSFLNSMGGTHMVAQGRYDYSYVLTSYVKESNRWRVSHTYPEKRSGSGSALAHATLEDVTAMLRVAAHYSISSFDIYAGLGFGVSHMKYRLSNFTQTSGFSKNESRYNSADRSSYQLVYSYDDLAHVEWSESTALGRFAASVFVGARYYVTPHWGVAAELGLPNATFAKDNNNYSIFSTGVSYKF